MAFTDPEEDDSHLPKFNEREFKCVLVGSGAVGKSTLARGPAVGMRYIPTIGVDVCPIRVSTSRGDVVFNVWDTAASERFGGCLRDGYYIGADCAIIMFDVTARASYRTVPQWHRDIVRVCGPIPIVVVGNKVDVAERKVKPKQITYPRKKNLQYYDVSAACDVNVEKPFLYFVHKLMNVAPSVRLVKSLRQKPIAPELQAVREACVARADAAHDFPPPPLVDSDEDDF